MDASMSRRVKMCPAGMTFDVKTSFPITNSSSRLVQDMRRQKCLSSERSSVSLPSGRRAICTIVSSSIPKKVKVVVGPTAFSSLTTTPNSEQSAMVVSFSRVHSSDCGEPASKKSSR